MREVIWDQHSCGHFAGASDFAAVSWFRRNADEGNEREPFHTCGTRPDGQAPKGKENTETNLGIDNERP